MKKIPIQITDTNVKFINDVDISFSKFVNRCIDQFRDLNKFKKTSKNEIKVMIEAGVDFNEIFT